MPQQKIVLFLPQQNAPAEKSFFFPSRKSSFFCLGAFVMPSFQPSRKEFFFPSRKSSFFCPSRMPQQKIILFLPQQNAPAENHPFSAPAECPSRKEFFFPVTGSRIHHRRNRRSRDGSRRQSQSPRRTRCCVCGGGTSRAGRRHKHHLSLIPIAEVDEVVRLARRRLGVGSLVVHSRLVSNRSRRCRRCRR